MNFTNFFYRITTLFKLYFPPLTNQKKQNIEVIHKIHG